LHAAENARWRFVIGVTDRSDPLAFDRPTRRRSAAGGKHLAGKMTNSCSGDETNRWTRALVIWMRALVLALVIALSPTTARADGPLLAREASSAAPGGPLVVDGGLVLAMPTALGTGLSSGFGAGVTRGHTFAWEARASWSTATESSIPWTVTQSDLRLRVGGALQHIVGRGRIGLRLGLGPTFVHESRLRNQGMSAALTGSALETSAWATLAAGDLEAVVALHLIGPWMITLSGGPSVAVGGGGWHGGWISLIGVGWQP
jgi:hypothetical protein